MRSTSSKPGRSWTANASGSALRAATRSRTLSAAYTSAMPRAMASVLSEMSLFVTSGVTPSARNASQARSNSASVRGASMPCAASRSVLQYKPNAEMDVGTYRMAPPASIWSSVSLLNVEMVGRSAKSAR